MNSLTGTATALKLALRRDRIMLPVWCYAFIAIGFSSAYGVRTLYATAEARSQLAAGLGHDPALIALYGPPFDLSTLGAAATWKIAGFGAAAAALFGLLTVIRHSRAEEAAGRAELLGAAVLGRHALLTAALLTSLIATAAIGIATAIGLVAGGLPIGPSLLFGATFTTAGWSFAGIAAITAQLTETSRTANGLAAALLAAAYLLRALGDSAGPTGPGWLSWLSPIAWSQHVHPYSDPQPWLLLLPIALTAATTALGYALVHRRDLGAGLLPTRPGRPAAARPLTGPLALAARLHRGLLLGWAVGFAIGGLALGSIATGIGGIVTGSPQAAQIITQMGGQRGLVDAYLAVIAGLFGPIAAVYTVQAALRPRAEETSGLAEPLIAGPVGRSRWLLSHLTCAAAGTAILLAISGVTTGLAYGASTGDIAGQLPRLLGAMMAQLPAAWVLTGLTIALFGLRPRWTPAAWALIGLFIVLGEFGPAVGLSQWALDLSPFTHLPKIPGGPVTATPLIWLTLLALALTAAGFAGFRRRDLT